MQTKQIIFLSFVVTSLSGLFEMWMELKYLQIEAEQKYFQTHNNIIPADNNAFRSPNDEM